MISSAVCFFACGIAMPSFSYILHLIFDRLWTGLKGAAQFQAAHFPTAQQPLDKRLST